MGRDKALIAIDGVPMVERAVATVRAAGADEVRVTGGDRHRLSALGLIVDPDPEPFAGPLAALIWSLERARHETVFVLACDVPGVSAEAVRAVVAARGDAAAAVPVHADRRQWLHGAWHRRCLPTLRSAYEAGERAIHRAVALLDVLTVEGLPAAALADADHPGDLPEGVYPAPMPIPEIDIAELVRRRQQGAVVLDVRQPQEFEEAHVPGAVLIPLDELPDRVDEVPDGDLLVICRSGGRSAKAIEFLETRGRSATNVAGGTLAWIDAGQPIGRGAGSP